MFFIGGISSGVKPLEYLKTVICGRCGAYGRYQVYMTYMYLVSFYPDFKETGAFSWKCRAAVRSTSWIRRWERDCFGARRSRSRNAI